MSPTTKRQASKRASSKAKALKVAPAPCSSPSRRIPCGRKLIGVTHYKRTGRYESHIWISSKEAAAELGGGEGDDEEEEADAGASAGGESEKDERKRKRGRGYQLHLGAFPDEETAKLAYDRASWRSRGPGAPRNEPTRDLKDDEFLLRTAGLGWSDFVLALRAWGQSLMPPRKPRKRRAPGEGSGGGDGGSDGAAAEGGGDGGPPKGKKRGPYAKKKAAASAWVSKFALRREAARGRPRTLTPEQLLSLAAAAVAEAEEEEDRRRRRGGVPLAAPVSADASGAFRAPVLAPAAVSPEDAARFVGRAAANASAAAATPVPPALLTWQPSASAVEAARAAAEAAMEMLREQQQRERAAAEEAAAAAAEAAVAPPPSAFAGGGGGNVVDVAAVAAAAAANIIDSDNGPMPALRSLRSSEFFGAFVNTDEVAGRV